MKCESCGARNNSKAAYCQGCGETLTFDDGMESTVYHRHTLEEEKPLEDDPKPKPDPFESIHGWFSEFKD